MDNLESLKVDTKDVNKIKNELEEVWNNFEKYGLVKISEKSNLSSEDVQIIEELFNKTKKKDSIKENVYSDLGLTKNDPEKMKTILYSLVIRMKEQVAQNPNVKVENIILGELHHLAQEYAEKSEEVKEYK
jgi:hypothetical protein